MYSQSCISGENPYPQVNIEDIRYLVLNEDLKLGRPEYATEEIYQIMRDCQNNYPGNRPTFEHLQNHMKHIAQVNKQSLFTSSLSTLSKQPPPFTPATGSGLPQSPNFTPVMPQPRSAFVQSPMYFNSDVSTFSYPSTGLDGYLLPSEGKDGYLVPSEGKEGYLIPSPIPTPASTSSFHVGYQNLNNRNFDL